MSRVERTSAPVARDAGAILNFEVPKGVLEINGIEHAIVPMTFVRRAKRVAASALSQAPDKKRKRANKIVRGLNAAIQHADKGRLAKVTRFRVR